VNTILFILLVILCLSIMASSLMRIDKLKPKIHRYSWAVMYMAMLATAGFTLAQAIEDKRMPSPALLSALVAIGLNLLLTHYQWRYGAAPISLMPPEALPTEPEYATTQMGNGK
jgi:hypothetical protein